MPTSKNPHKKKIAFIFYEFVSSSQKGASGGNISNYLLIDYLRHYADICIIAPDIQKELIAELESKGIRVITEALTYRLPIKHFRKRQWIKTVIKRHLLNDPAHPNTLDTVVASNGTSDLATALQSNKTQLYILCRAFEDFYNHDSYYPFKEKLKRFLIKTLDSHKIYEAYRRADRIVTNSEYMKDFICSHYPKVNISVLYPPIDIPVKALKPVPSAPRIGIINPSLRKGEAIFLSLARNYPALKFVYFSPSPKNYMLDNISYAGWFSDREELFSNTDILIAPSVWSEPFGRVGVEAIRSGIPALVSDAGGLPETVDNDFVVSGQSVELWKKKLDWMMNNSSEVESAWHRSVMKSEDFGQAVHDRNALNIFTSGY